MTRKRIESERLADDAGDGSDGLPWVAGLKGVRGKGRCFDWLRRAGHSADLAPGWPADRGSCVGEFSGLLPAGEPEGSLGAIGCGLTPRSVLEKLGQMQMADVHVPTNDGRA